MISLDQTCALLLAYVHIMRAAVARHSRGGVLQCDVAEFYDAHFCLLETVLPVPPADEVAGHKFSMAQLKFSGAALPLFFFRRVTGRCSGMRFTGMYLQFRPFIGMLWLVGYRSVLRASLVVCTLFQGLDFVPLTGCMLHSLCVSKDACRIIYGGLDIYT